MKNSIIVILSILLLILSSYLCKSWFIQHQAVAAEEEHQKQYKELSNKESKEDAARMEEAFKNLDKTR